MRGRCAARDLARSQGGGGRRCPPIADKPDAISHVDYQGVKHMTYCYGPITITPGQNIINLRPAIDGNGNKLWPQEDGYITRFDPEFIYADGTVPRVDVLHLHHAVWAVNGNPQFAAGEEKTIQQLPRASAGASHPGDSWILNDMLHDLVAQPAQVYVVWRVDFVPVDLACRRLDTPGAHQVDGRRREPEPLSGLRRPASGRPQRHLHVPRSGAGLGPPSVRRGGR